MVYEYACHGCRHRFDVTKSHKDMEVNETCPKCGEFAERQFVPQRVYISGAKVTHPEYNPGLGCVVQNKRHKDDLLKRKGLVEVGNDFNSGDSMQKKFDTDRVEKREKAWESVDV